MQNWYVKDFRHIKTKSYYLIYLHLILYEIYINSLQINVSDSTSSETEG